MEFMLEKVKDSDLLCAWVYNYKTRVSVNLYT